MKRQICCNFISVDIGIYLDFFFFFNQPDQKGVLKIDHSQIPELQSGIYKMSVKSGVVKIESVIGERTISAALPTMPGPKGGVLILGTRFDLSRVSRGTPTKPTAVAAASAATSPMATGISVTPTLLSPEKSGGGGGLVLKTAAASVEHQSPAFRGIFPKGKVLDDGKLIAKPDFHSKSFSAVDANSAKKVGGSAIRKVLGPTLTTAAAARGRARTSIGNQSGVSKLKTGFGKGEWFFHCLFGMEWCVECWRSRVKYVFFFSGLLL